MGKGSSKVGGGGGGKPKQVVHETQTVEGLKAGDVISPGAENWTIKINNESISSHVKDYITVDAVKVGPKTIKVTGHYDLSGQFPVGSKAAQDAKKKLIKVTKTFKRDAQVTVRRQ